MPKKSSIMALIVFATLIGIGGTYLYFRSHTVNDAEDRRRWLGEVDKANAESGFTKDTNGELIFVATANGQPAPARKGAAK
jgi:hypothetical protein